MVQKSKRNKCKKPIGAGHLRVYQSENYVNQSVANNQNVGVNHLNEVEPI